MRSPMTVLYGPFLAAVLALFVPGHALAADGGVCPRPETGSVVQPPPDFIAKDGVPLIEPTPGDTILIAPGERYTVLYKAEEVGTWAWHCHILDHAEGTTGMFGMVTALIVTP